MSLRKRGANYWEITVSDGVDPTGKKLRTFYSFRGTKREAEAEDRRLQRERDLGIHVKPSKLTLSAFLERWLNDHARLHISARTLDGYRDIARPLSANMP